MVRAEITVARRRHGPVMMRRRLDHMETRLMVYHWRRPRFAESRRWVTRIRHRLGGSGQDQTGAEQADDQQLFLYFSGDAGLLFHDNILLLVSCLSVIVWPCGRGHNPFIANGVPGCPPLIYLIGKTCYFAVALLVAHADRAQFFRFPTDAAGDWVKKRQRFDTFYPRRKPRESV